MVDAGVSRVGRLSVAVPGRPARGAACGGARRGAGARPARPRSLRDDPGRGRRGRCGRRHRRRPRHHCGATIDRPVDLRGHGHATIVGCADGRRCRTACAPASACRAPTAPAPPAARTSKGSPSTARGISAANLEPLGVGDHRDLRERRARRAQPGARHRPGHHEHGRRSLGDRRERDRRPRRLRLHGRAVRRRRRHRHSGRARPAPDEPPAAGTSSPATSSTARSPTASACSRWWACSCSPPTARSSRATVCRSRTIRTRTRSDRACWSTIPAAASRR